MSGSSVGFATRSILLSTSTTGILTPFSRSDTYSSPLPGPRRRVEDEHHDVHFAQRLDRRVHHPHVQPVQRPVDARRVDEHDLAVRDGS